MKNRDLVINLIRQDLKHNQLLQGLDKLGLNSDLHHLGIFELVAKLMGIKKGQISDRFFDIYFSFHTKAARLKITDTGHNLQHLAEACYKMLAECN